MRTIQSPNIAKRFNCGWRVQASCGQTPVDVDSTTRRRADKSLTERMSTIDQLESTPALDPMVVMASHLMVMGSTKSSDQYTANHFAKTVDCGQAQQLRCRLCLMNNRPANHRIDTRLAKQSTLFKCQKVPKNLMINNQHSEAIDQSLADGLSRCPPRHAAVGKNNSRTKQNSHPNISPSSLLILILIFLHVGPASLESSRVANCTRQLWSATQPDQYRPDCTDDGQYKPVQCHADYCWCSTPEGRPLIGSAVKRPTVPRCPPSRTNRRRESRPFKPKRICSQSDRMAFNANLVNIFKSELKRTSNGTSDSVAVVLWKFRRLDTNSDNKLGKKELRYLRQMLAKVVEPTHCARLFFSYCDTDANGSVDRQEWQLCLGVSGSDLSLRLFMSLSKGQSSSEGESSAPMFPLKPAGSDKPDEEEDVNMRRDCVSVREAALNEDVAFGVFVPQCDQRGNFEEVQCLKTLCWCVWIRSGKPIRNSAVRDGRRPDCERAKKSAKAYKGCSVKRKSRFLEMVVDRLIQEYQNETKRVYHGQGEETRWKFAKLDVNNNEVLEPSEWRQWRMELKSVTSSKLRKCGRNLLRFCDSDANKRLTIEEFQECLHVRRPNGLGPRPDAGSALPKRPRNPFVSILKSD